MKKAVWILSLVLFAIGCSPIDNEQEGESKSRQEPNGQFADEQTKDKENGQWEDHLSGSRLDESITVDSEGNQVVTNPDDFLVVSNKERNLPEDYEPEDLVIPDVPFPFEEHAEKKYMRKEAAKALEEMFADAKANDVQLYAMSGYRSFERQKAVYASNVKRLGKDEAKKVSASPGQSEHQTGLAMDVTSPQIDYRLTEAFENTPEGKWVLENAHHYGFIIRYPKGKESITGYSYEPWHLRYVGKEHAAFIKENGLTLEEYLSGSLPVYQEKN